MKIDELIALYRGHKAAISQTDDGFLRNMSDALGHYDASELTPTLIDERYTQRRLKQVQPNSVARELKTTAAVLNHARRMGVIPSVPYIRRPAFNDERIRLISVEERDAMLAEARPAEFRAVVAFLFYTGARLSEALNATPREVRDGAVMFVSHKGTAGKPRYRQVPLHPVLRPLLVSNSSWLLPSPTGAKWGARDVRRHWETLCDFTDMEDCRLHDCRHHFASHLVMAGVDLITIAALTGHSDLGMLKRYAHHHTSHLRGVIDIL